MESLVTGLKTHFATSQDRIVMFIIAVLLLLVGFLGGYWTAEMEKETVVVFEDVKQPEGVLDDTDIRFLRQQVDQIDAEQSSLEDQSLLDVNNANIPQQQIALPMASQSAGSFVASINGTKYYYPDCGDVSRIKEENKIWFSTEQEAIQAGYGMSACIARRRTP